jgi:hypothetical protein
MTLWSTEPLTEMSTRNLPGGKGRPAREAKTSPTSVSRLSGKCGSLDVSQSCGRPRPVTGIALFFFYTYIGFASWFQVRPLGKQCTEMFYVEIFQVPVLEVKPSKSLAANSHSMIDLSIYLSIYLWLYSPLLGLGGFFSLFIFYTAGRAPWMGISLSRGRYLHTGRYKHRINAHGYPCLERDSNPRSQRSSERRQFMP